jgi:hypothetical protein
MVDYVAEGMAMRCSGTRKVTTPTKFYLLPQVKIDFHFTDFHKIRGYQAALHKTILCRISTKSVRRKIHCKPLYDRK